MARFDVKKEARRYFVTGVALAPAFVFSYLSDVDDGWMVCAGAVAATVGNGVNLILDVRRETKNG